MATVPTIAGPRIGRVPDVATGGPPGGRRGRNLLAVGLFMGPAAILLGAIVVYPALATVARSFYDRSGGAFVGTDNYRTLFGSTEILVAIRNNAIWVIVFPFLVTFIGLVFAVLTERIRWSTAFKTIVFMPMAISLFATGVIWRIVYETDPHRGVINSAVGTVVDTFHPPGSYAAATNIKPSTATLTARSDGSMVTAATLSRGDTAQLGLTGILPEFVPTGARDAQPPATASGAITGIVWRDFSVGGTPGVIDSGEKGLPGMHLDLLSSDGSTAATTTTDISGTFRFDNPSPGSYRVAVDSSNFRAPFGGVNWLGVQSLTPTGGLGTTARALLSIPLADLSAIVAMLWVWCGFAMVVIGAGLAALNREVLEAAKVDGATEWQTFRHVTFPLLRPVLIVVFITMIINVLKIFDIILALVPDSSHQETNVIALKMWELGFTGGQELGLSSALAVFLFVLVIPVIFLNIRRIQG
jgi:alpha-glucoside transport system permease protein